MKIVIQRRKSESQNIWRTEIPDHAVRDQRLHHRITLRMAEADLGTAPFRIARRMQRQVGTRGLDPGDERFGQFDGPGTQVRQVHIVPDIQRRIQRRHRDHRRRADAHAFDPRRRGIVRIKGKRRLVAHPALQDRLRGIRMPGMNPDEGRRARPAVQVFIGAADGKIGIGPDQIDIHGARRMRQIPYRQRPGIMRPVSQRPHVVTPASAVIDLGDHQNGQIIVYRCLDLFGGDDAQFRPDGARQPLGDIQIRGEIAAVGQDHPPIRPRRARSTDRLKHLDRQRVAHHDLARPRPDQPRDPVPDPARLGVPSSPVPAGDQHFGPFILHHRRDPRLGGLGHRPQRIAVKISDSLRQVERGAGSGEIGHGLSPYLTGC